MLEWLPILISFIPGLMAYLLSRSASHTSTGILTEKVLRNEDTLKLIQEKADRIPTVEARMASLETWKVYIDKHLDEIRKHYCDKVVSLGDKNV